MQIRSGFSIGSLRFSATTKITDLQFRQVAQACRQVQGEAAVRAKMKQTLLEITGDPEVMSDYHCEPLPDGGMNIHTGADIAAYLARSASKNGPESRNTRRSR